MPAPYFMPILLAVLLAGCSGSSSAPPASSSSSSGSSSSSSSSSSSASSSGAATAFKLNQLGFLPTASKIALVEENQQETFNLIDNLNGEVVYSGTLIAAARWAPTNENVHQADFSAWTTPGSYHLEVAGLPASSVFAIDDEVLTEVHRAALKAYYFNRASSALDAEFAGVWARPAGHPDDEVLVHSSAATPERPEGTILSAPKGWYDAGDYNKYVVNSGISTYTLLAAYEHFPSIYQNLETAIPESNNGRPDILDEILWNIDWLEQMQDLDGGVYHKLTTANFSGQEMPHETTQPRYVVQKTTPAALNFAAVMAVASRVYAPFLPDRAEQFQQAALAAWQWAQENPSILYVQPEDIHTGTYAPPNETLRDEFAWAAAELFLLTEESGFLTAFFSQNQNASVPSWAGVSALGFISLAHHGETLMTEEDYAAIEAGLLNTGNALLNQQQASAYGIAMTNGSFNWGSNSEVLNRAIMMLEAYRITDDENYLHAALAHVDYVLGRNATDYSFVTGFGHRSPMRIHHRQSDADDIDDPVPGFLAGGPHTGQQDGCAYEYNLPAKTYLDHWCSYSTNEVAINWNAPLVYVLGAVRAYFGQ